jgi:hypothetical protein
MVFELKANRKYWIMLMYFRTYEPTKLFCKGPRNAKIIQSYLIAFDSNQVYTFFKANFSSVFRILKNHIQTFPETNIY